MLLLQQFRIAAIRLGQPHLFEQGFQPVIPHAHSLPDKVTAQGTCQVTLATACRARQQQILLMTQPVSFQQLADLRLAHASTRPIVQLLHLSG